MRLKTFQHLRNLVPIEFGSVTLTRWSTIQVNNYIQIKFRRNKACNWRIKKYFVCSIIGILNFPAFDESKAFHGETLFIQPTKSSYISEGDEAEIRRIFPNAQFRWIKQKSATTYFHVEKHTEFMQSVLGFLHGKDNRTKDDGNEETPKEENSKKS